MNSSTFDLGCCFRVDFHCFVVFVVLIWSPVWFEYLFKRLDFSCMLLKLVESMARPSAKSRSSKCDSRSHCIPLDLSDVDFFITQSIVMMKSIGEMIHPCFTPDSIWNQSDVLLLRIMLHSNFS